MLKKTTSSVQRSGLFYALILAATAFALYSNTIPNNYAIDDNIVAVNPMVQKGIRAIPEIVTTRYQTSGQYSYGYRPVVKAMFAVEQSLFGGNPHISHFINVLIYAGTAVVLFYFMTAWFTGYSRFFIFSVALLFTAHPVHTEAVASLKNREELLCFLGSITALHCFLIFWSKKKPGYFLLGVLLLLFSFFTKQNAIVFSLLVPLTVFFFGYKTVPDFVFQPFSEKSTNIRQSKLEQPGDPMQQIVKTPDFLFLASIIFLVIGLSLNQRFINYSVYMMFLSCFKGNKSKGGVLNVIKNKWVIAGMVFIPIAILTAKPVFFFSFLFFLVYKYSVSPGIKNPVDYCFRKMIHAAIPVKNFISSLIALLFHLKYILAAIAFIAIILLGSWYLPDLFLSQEKRELYLFENPLFSGGGWMARIALGFYSLFTYLKILVFPHPLLFYYGYRQIPDVTVFNPVVIFSVIIHAGLLVTAMVYFRKHKLLAYGLFYYFFSITAFSNLPAPVPGIVAERLLYIPSLGFCIVIAWLIFRIFKTDPATARIHTPAKRKILIVLCLLLVAYSYKTISRNRDWKDEFTLYSHDIPYLKNSFHANILYASQLIMRANSPVQPGTVQDLDKAFLALKHFKQALAIDSTDTKTLANIGTLFYQFLGRYDSAEWYFNRALHFDSLFAVAHFNLGFCYEIQGKQAQAVSEYRRAAILDITDIRPLSALANFYFKSGMVDSALTVNQRIMIVHPASDIPYINLGNFALENKDETTAVAWFEKAVEKNPGNAALCRQLSDYFISRGNAKKAEYYQRIIYAKRE